MNYMSKTTFFKGMVLILSVLAVLSCVSNLPMSARMQNILDTAECSAGMSDEEWDILIDEYYTLSEEFRANLSSYTPEEKQEIYQKIGKINGIITKREASRIMDTVTEIGNSLPALLDGFVSGLTGE